MDVLRIATAGSVDDGKSTLIGRLLFETNSITSDKLEAIEKASQRKGIGFIDLSLLTDGLIAEREQGITIDVAHIYFNTPKRKFIIADTPGHVEYTRNMITGASKANASLILIDARKGIVEQTHRHFHIASLLRIPTVIVCINKMDLVNYDQNVFETIKTEFEKLVGKTEGYKPDISYLPISSLHGDNLTTLSQNMPWYTGISLLATLEIIKTGEEKLTKPSRMPVQYVVRPRSNEFHDYRAYAGRLSSGQFNVGDEIVALPSGRKSKISKLFQYTQELQEVKANQSFTLLLEDNIDISRGDMLVKTEDAPTLKNEFNAQCCWLNNTNLALNKTYLIQHGTQLTKAKITKVNYVQDPITQLRNEEVQTLKMNDLASISIKTAKALPIDVYAENQSNGAFILIDETSNQTLAVGFVYA